jgi:hypothetical protein
MVSLDGGGVRGVCILVILETLMKKVKTMEAMIQQEEENEIEVKEAALEESKAVREEKGGENEVKKEKGKEAEEEDVNQEGVQQSEGTLAKYFDLVGGTSTGGYVEPCPFKTNLCLVLTADFPTDSLHSWYSAW